MFIDVFEWGWLVSFQQHKHQTVKTPGKTNSAPKFPQENNAGYKNKIHTPVSWVGVLAAVPALRNHTVMTCRYAPPLQALFTL